MLLFITNFLLYFLIFSCLFLLHIFMNLEFRIMFCEKEDDYAPAARELWWKWQALVNIRLFVFLGEILDFSVIILISMCFFDDYVPAASELWWKWRALVNTKYERHNLVLNKVSTFSSGFTVLKMGQNFGINTNQSKLLHRCNNISKNQPLVNFTLGAFPKSPKPCFLVSLILKNELKKADMLKFCKACLHKIKIEHIC